MRNGISMDSYDVELPAAREIAQRVCERLPLRGAWFLQLRETAEGEPVLLEVGARIAGTMAVSRCLGVNLPLLTIMEMERRPISVMRNDSGLRIDRALVNRYTHEHRYSAVYVDLDDTLVIDGKVNTLLVRFLYQCINAGCPLHLVTRHARDPLATLRAHRLDWLFDSVHHLRADEPKSSVVAEPDAILIDDSFGERLQVHEALGIATFDCSMLEALIDERV
jgi:hypothetical protein